MAFPLMDDFVFDFEAQTDYPNWTPAQTKEYMNARGEELRVALNAVANLLNATTSDASGADNIGIPETIAGSGTNVRDRADWLYSQIVAAILGAIPDGSLTTIKYADGSVTAAKCAADVATQDELDVLAGVGRTTETVKGVADDLTEHQTNDIKHAPDAIGTVGQVLAVNTEETATEWKTITISDASDTVKGIVELATAEEVTIGTSTTLAVTPAGAKVELDKKARIVSSTYTGNGSASDRTISLDFTPSLVMIMLVNGSYVGISNANSNSQQRLGFFTSTGSDSRTTDSQSGFYCTTNGFVLHYPGSVNNMNANATTYRYVAIG